MLSRSGWLCAGMACLWIAGCASGPEQRAKVSYRESAQENFLKGKKEFEDGDYMEAIEYFRFVRAKFPFSAYAAESDLLLADCHFERDRFLEAADAYHAFIKLHPKHEKVPYAMFRIAMSSFKRVPSDWWFMPPAFEMDQEETKKAIGDFQRYLSRYPQDENAPEATEHLNYCRSRLADRVRYVMMFYWDKERMQAVLWRAEEILSQFAGLGYDEEALFFKARALLGLEQVPQAREALMELVTRFPDGEHRDSAQDLLSALPVQDLGTSPAPAPATAPAPAPVSAPESESVPPPAPPGEQG